MNAKDTTELLLFRRYSMDLSEEACFVVNMFVYRRGFICLFVFLCPFFFCTATFSNTIMRHFMVSLMAILEVLFLYRYLKAEPKHRMDSRTNVHH